MKDKQTIFSQFVMTLIVFLTAGMSACTNEELNHTLGNYLGNGSTIAKLDQNNNSTNPSGNATVSRPNSGHVTNNPRSNIHGNTALGPSCGTGKSNSICLGIKYIVYANSYGQGIVNQQEAFQNLEGINRVWSQCGIAFQIDQYLVANAQDYRLRYNPQEYDELNDIRRTFSDDVTLLVVTTGKWMGNLDGPANAWTNMPGEIVYGAVMESVVATFPNIIAHELGHYMNLDHNYSDTTNLMTQVIADNSVNLNQGQCQVARDGIQNYWQRMLRS